MANAAGKSWLGLKGPFGVYLTLLVVPVLALQGLVYVQIVDQTIGAFPIMKRLRMISEDLAEPKVAVLRSDINAGFAGEHPEYYYDLSAFWNFLAEGAGFEHRLITDAELARGLGDSATVLILPWTTCLDKDQRQAIRAFLEAGNSVIATGPVGARDEKNEWVGWDFLNELTGLLQVVSITPEQQTYASFRGNQFYSGTVPAGLLLSLPQHVLAVGIGHTPDIYWSDANWRPVSVEWPSEAALGVHRTVNKGRVIWMGFNERLSGNAKSRILFERYLHASLQWVGRQPLALPQTWPDEKAVAAIPYGEFGSNLDAAQKAADVFSREQIPATLFCQSSAALRKPADAALIRERVELATSGDSPDAFAGQNLVKQAERLRKAKAELDTEKIPLVGFKPPQAAWGPETLMALRSAGFHYLVDSGENDRALPELIEFRASSFLGRKAELTRLPAGWAQDVDVVAAYTGPTPWKEDIADPFVRDLELAGYLGGIYTMGIREDLLGAPENQHILRSLLKRLRRDDAWLTTADGLAQWWSRREKIRVEATRVHQHRIRVSVTNRGRDEMGKYVVDLHLPYRPKKVRLLSEMLGKAPPQYELRADEEILRLEFTKLKRESSQVFLVALDEL